MGRCPYCDKENPGDARFCNYCGKSIDASAESGPAEPSTDKQTIDCPKCSHPNPTYATYCGKCGASIGQSSGSRFKPLSSTQRICWNCGTTMSIYDYECPNCHSSLSSAQEADYLSDTKSAGSGPVAAGVLLLVSGVLAILNGLLIMYVSSSIQTYGFNMGCCGGIEFLFGILVIGAGVLSLGRKSWGLVLAGSIIALISVGPVFLSSILGLVALILVAVNKEQYG